ncbi:hypothetical protein Tco_0048750 [Tanacetum coccineum]
MWVGSAGVPYGVHRFTRPFCRRCAPGLNWLGRASGAVTLKEDPVELDSSPTLSGALPLFLVPRLASAGLSVKAWPNDPLDLQNLKLEVSEKLPQG